MHASLTPTKFGNMKDHYKVTVGFNRTDLRALPGTHFGKGQEPSVVFDLVDTLDEKIKRTDGNMRVDVPFIEVTGELLVELHDWVKTPKPFVVEIEVTSGVRPDGGYREDLAKALRQKLFFMSGDVQAKFDKFIGQMDSWEIGSM